MTNCQKCSLFLLRIGLGWMFLYAGLTKIMDPNWSAEGYLRNAKSFSGLYTWLANSSLLPFINFINEWGLTLIGVALILGVFVRLTGYLGPLLMLLYYFPVLDFPKISTHSFIIDEHIIYLFVFLVLAAYKADSFWSVRNLIWKNKSV